MKTAIIVFPGSNREHDAARAIAAVTGRAARLVWHGETVLPDCDLVILPGGFSYGDYLRTGAIAAHAPIMDAVRRAATRGVAVLGICNGFQILCEAGLLPGVLLRNATRRFVCREVYLRVETVESPFTRGLAKGRILRTPVAHGDGNYAIDDDGLKALEDRDRVALRYCDASGAVVETANPNGAIASIAGILSENRRVLGLMPHLENAIDPMLGSVDGRDFFAALCREVA